MTTNKYLIAYIVGSLFDISINMISRKHIKMIDPYYKSQGLLLASVWGGLTVIISIYLTDYFQDYFNKSRYLIAFAIGFILDVILNVITRVVNFKPLIVYYDIQGYTLAGFWGGVMILGAVIITDKIVNLI